MGDREREWHVKAETHTGGHGPRKMLPTAKECLATRSWKGKEGPPLEAS